MLVVGILLVAVVLALCVILYRMSCRIPEEMRQDTPFRYVERDVKMNPEVPQLLKNLQALDFEEVWVTSCDGLRLRGFYHHTADGAPAAILMHGWRGVPFRDMCGGATECLAMGMNVLVVCQRGHCGSEGRCLTFGVKERRDCVTWAEYLARRLGKDTPVLLCGVSMGAATVLMSLALPLPENVKGVFADCPYSAPKDIMLQVAHTMHIPGRLCWPFMWLAQRVFCGFDPNSATAREAVTHARVPVVIVHGEADTFVPQEMSEEIRRAAPDRVRRYTFPGAEHADSYNRDTERYRTLLRDFCREIFPEASILSGGNES